MPLYVGIQLHHWPCFALFEIAHGCRYPLNYFSLKGSQVAACHSGFLGVPGGCLFRLKDTSGRLTCALTLWTHLGPLTHLRT